MTGTINVLFVKNMDKFNSDCVVTEYSYNIRPFMMMYTYDGEPQSNICSTGRTPLLKDIYWK
jgi:hypothetical protein